MGQSQTAARSFSSLRDNLGRPSDIIAVDGVTRSVTYNTRDSISEITDGNNEKTVLDFDALERMTTFTLPNGNKTSQSFDNRGNVIEIMDGQSNSSTRHAATDP